MTEIQVQRLYSLIPLCVEYKEGDEIKTTIVHMDFVKERIFWHDGQLFDPDSPMGLQLMEVLKEKKGEAYPLIPDAVIQEAESIHKQSTQAVNNVRKQTEFEGGDSERRQEEATTPSGDTGSSSSLD